MKPWAGKALPSAQQATLVRVRFRNGRETGSPTPASYWRWKWGGGFPAEYEFDVIAYEKVEE